ncbi:MAG: hypothetical protein ACU85U_19435 [Gammaproteobacteria bacterium]|jgi:hypothetical protein
MKWYVTAFGTCVVVCAIAAIIELGRAGASDVWFTVVRWTAIGCGAFAILCMTIAPGCGAPRRRSE